MPTYFQRTQMKRNVSEKQQKPSEPSSSSGLMSFLYEPKFTILLDFKVTTTFDNKNTIFDLEPKLFQPVKSKPFLFCIPRKDHMNPFAKRLIKEYDVIPEDCNRVGVNLELGFKEYLKETERSAVGSMSFHVFSLSQPEDEEKQQLEMDKGIPEGIYTKYLMVSPSSGRNPRVHERLNYDYLYFLQPWICDRYEVSEKMLNCHFLALKVVITNPEVLENFKGWGIIVDFAKQSKISSSFIIDRIEEWVNGKSAKRRLTGLFDDYKGCEHEKGCECYAPIISTKEIHQITGKIANDCEALTTVTPHHTLIRITRKDGERADLLIFHDQYKTQECEGIAFIQPPDDEMTNFIRAPHLWGCR